MSARRRAHPTEAELVLVSGPGVESFESFYRREYRGVVALAYALSGGRHESEDFAQDAFVAAHRRWAEIAQYDQPAAWVRRVVANMSVSKVRRRSAEARALVRLRGRRPPVVEALAAPDAKFWEAVRSLPKRQAQTVALHYLFDLPVADVAKTLEISEGAVKAHLHRARAALSQKLGLWEEPS